MRRDRSTSSTNSPHSRTKNRPNSDLFMNGVGGGVRAGALDSTEADPSRGNAQVSASCWFCLCELFKRFF